MSDVDLCARVEATMCITYGQHPGGREEARISREDWEELKRTLRLALHHPGCRLTPVVTRAIQETLGEPVNITPTPKAPPARDEEIERLKGEIEKFRSERSYVVGFNEGWQSAKDEDKCPVCLEPFKLDDVCATDIELSVCHATCLEGSPVVNLDTGEPIGGEIDTYLYGSLFERSGATLSDRSVSGDAVRVKIKPLEWKRGTPESVYGQNSFTARHTAGGEYVIRRMYSTSSWTFRDTVFDTADQAKAAAQVDYESHIRSSLVTADRTQDGRDEPFTREQVEAHVNKRLEEFAIAQQSVSASKDELIRELVRVLKPFGEEADCYEPDTGDNDDTPLATPAYFKIRDLRAARAALTLASEAGYNDGGEK